MSSGRDPAEILDRLITPDELKKLMVLDLSIVINDTFATAETILRRRDPEEAEPALAALRISKRIAMEDVGAQMARYMLMRAVEILGDDHSRDTFKMELLGLSRMRAMSP